MLLSFIAVYILVSVSIGLYFSLRVKSSADYFVASRALPMYVTIATVFATWFGSESVLGVSSSFLDEGLHGVIGDPFGASLCLILAGLLFAKPLYRMRILTIGDYYRIRYGRTVELLISIFICISYLGWVSAQITALGLVFNMITDGAISLHLGMVIGISAVLIYTLFGGMWAVAVTDFVQTVVIIAGLIIIAYIVSDMAGGFDRIVSHAAENHKFNFAPEMSPRGILFFIGAVLTMGFGSIPQQDVFQRILSAKNEKVAVWGTVAGGCLYFVITFIPIYLAYSAHLIEPDAVKILLAEDSQRVLPDMIMKHTPIFIQILFFGALLSAIMSTASGTLLAPSAIFTENIVKGSLTRLKDKTLLRITRITVFCFAVIVLVVALSSELSIIEMVENAYKVTLAGAFVPLFCGVYWKRSNRVGALTSMFFGITAWLYSELFIPEEVALMPAQLLGFFASAAGMVIGVMFSKKQSHHSHVHKHSDA